jgi:selT/selW/selH-like putative selenoprotein
MFGFWADIVPGATGSFEVYVDEQLIFSKLQEDRFPNENEIIEFIEGLENVR